MPNLKDSWSSFTVEELFERIIPTKGKTTGELISGNDVPYIAAAKTNNGYVSMCSKKEHPEWISKGNAIVFVQLGDGAAGIAHYVPMDFIGMNGKTSCGYNSKITKNSGVFIAKCLSSNKAIFSHGHSWTGRRLLTTKTMLPTNESGEPDYQYMANYSKSKVQAMLDRYKAYAEKELSKIEYKEILPLYEKEWKNYFIPFVFEKIKRGKRLKKADHIKGLIPYVSSTGNNNGVDAYIEALQGTRTFSSCISLANSGSVGKAFYEPFKFVASDHVTSLKTDGFTKYLYLFICSAIEKQSCNYNFNREINEPRIKKMQIMLPSTSEGSPDYEYMEQYAKNLMYKKYNQYLSYLKSKNC